MTFQQVLARVVDRLQREQRLSYRALKRQFDLDDDDLMVLEQAVSPALQGGKTVVQVQRKETTMVLGLQDKVALVTGAARGIGRAIAVRLAQEGADVAVADIREALLGDTVAEIEKQGRRALALNVDVTQKAQVERMVEQVVRTFNRLDIFFNNAGIIKVHEFLEITEEDWDRIMDVNAKGVFLCGQAVARQMVRQGHGKIINTASIAARQGVVDSAVYAASKAAVMSLTRSMALSLAKTGVTVNALAPGMVDTDMWALIDEQTATLRGMPQGEPRARRIRRIPLGRAALPTDIANVAAFLASSNADYMTGQTLNIDGGNIQS